MPKYRVIFRAAALQDHLFLEFVNWVNNHVKRCLGTDRIPLSCFDAGYPRVEYY